MRKEKIWVIAHPDQERIYVQPTSVSAERGRALRQQGFMIFVTEVTFPPVFSSSAEPIESTGLQEQWEKSNGSDPAVE